MRLQRRRAAGLIRMTVTAALVAALTNAARAADEPAAPAAGGLSVATMRGWIEQMMREPRGPFDRIRYFCKDGQVLEPKAYACEPYGGGYQHGEWSARTRAIREAGYPIANLLVMVKPDDVVGPNAKADLLQVLVVERFLIASDDGWVFRRALSYRGAIQDHNEKESARDLLQALARGDTAYIPLREAARAFPHGPDTPSLTRVRGMATSLDEKDAKFHSLRSRIHNTPESGDAARVRAYASSTSARPELAAEYEALAAAIDAAYQPKPLSIELKQLGRYLKDETARDELQKLIEAQFATEQPGATLDAQLAGAANTLVWLKDRALQRVPASGRLAAIDVSLEAENRFMVTASKATAQIPTLTREARLHQLRISAKALYSIGLLNQREWDSLGESLSELEGKVKLDTYREALEYLERASSWSTQRLHYEFGNGVDKLTPIAPEAEGFVADRLRSSPLLFYSSLLQTLREDADKLAGTSQTAFGASVGGGLRRLNPGIARGLLRVSVDEETNGQPAIYLVPETTSDLPAAAGILTEAEGNPVSHVQLLARNLGIPNVVVASELMPTIRQHDGERIVVAASVGGVVQIDADGPRWDQLLGSAGEAKPSLMIVPDLAKLDLLRQDFVSTDELRASDSGRIVGPKAAHVGELSHRFKGHVAPGLAVSFGIFRELLKQPVKAGGEPMYDWMRDQYAEMAVLRKLDPSRHEQRVKQFLAFTRNWFATEQLPQALLDRLHGAMIERFGMDGTYGVFVRSDTNIEDLPGFTGAGLNLTVPNVVGFEETVAALRKVWASPYTERAYGWRQDLMDQPEHIYVSVLLHRSVPNEKSGVMITADVDTGSLEALTVTTSLGVGGGVDGEASETLRVDRDKAEAQLLSSATARRQRQLLASGGVSLLRAPAPERVLTDKEIELLAEFAREVPRAYPELHDDQGKTTPADVEFGFVAGKLMLQQIRPFLQNRAAASQGYLAKMDQGLRARDGKRVPLDEKPEAGS